jgi:hypothetical protein
VGTDGYSEYPDGELRKQLLESLSSGDWFQSDDGRSWEWFFDIGQELHRWHEVDTRIVGSLDVRRERQPHFDGQGLEFYGFQNGEVYRRQAGGEYRLVGPAEQPVKKDEPVRAQRPEELEMVLVDIFEKNIDGWIHDYVLELIQNRKQSKRKCSIDIELDVDEGDGQSIAVTYILGHSRHTIRQFFPSGDKGV